MSLSPSSAAGAATSNSQYAEFAQDLTAAIGQYTTVGDSASSKALSALLSTYWSGLTLPAKAECLRLCVQSLPLHNAICRAVLHSRAGQYTDLVCQWLYELYQSKPTPAATTTPIVAAATAAAAGTTPLTAVTSNVQSGGRTASASVASNTAPAASASASATAAAPAAGVHYSDLQLYVLQFIPVLVWSYLVRTGSNRTAPGIGAVLLGVYNHERLKSSAQRAVSYGAAMTNAALPSLATASVYHIPQPPFTSFSLSSTRLTVSSLLKHDEALTKRGAAGAVGAASLNPKPTAAGASAGGGGGGDPNALPVITDMSSTPNVMCIAHVCTEVYLCCISRMQIWSQQQWCAVVAKWSTQWNGGWTPPPVSVAGALPANTQQPTRRHSISSSPLLKSQLPPPTLVVPPVSASASATASPARLSIDSKTAASLVPAITNLPPPLTSAATPVTANGSTAASNVAASPASAVGEASAAATPAAAAAAAAAAAPVAYEAAVSTLTFDELFTRLKWQWGWNCDEGAVPIASAATAGATGGSLDVKHAPASAAAAAAAAAPAAGAGAGAGAGSALTTRHPVSVPLMEDFVNGLSYVLEVSHSSGVTHALALQALHRVQARATEDLIPEILLATTVLIDNLYDK